MKFKSYSRIKKKAEEAGLPSVRVPNLLSMQIDSFEDFLQRDVHPQKRIEFGLESVFQSVFPLEDPKGLYKLEYLDYEVLKEKYSVEECVERNLSFQAPVKARMRLTKYDEEVLKDTGEKQEKEQIEQDVFLGEIPLITTKGTFVINGAERIIISQLHRSPGIFFSETKHPSGKSLFSAKLIPYTGSWLEFTMDIHNAMYVLIDKRRKLPVTVLLRSLGYSTNQDLREHFYESEELKLSEAEGRHLFEDIKDKDGDLLLPGGSELDSEASESLRVNKIKKVKIISINSEVTRKILEQTIAKDTTESKNEALVKIYSLIRPGDEPTPESAEDLFERMFFNEKRYNLGKVGRYKLNSRLELEIDPGKHIVTREDMVAIVSKLIAIFDERDRIDDIDHLANRRVRTVGELLGEQYNIGLARVARTALERMNIANPDEITIHDLINSNALIAVVQSFFLTGQLSQFMEQTNPLTALTHKRRLSALGPGGLTRERAGFEVRDVHYSHYGRVCPIETPEGPNIGLLSSPAMYSKINSLGFLETPYVKVVDSKITDQVDYLDPQMEDKYTIAQANINYNPKTLEITDKLVFARKNGEYVQEPPENVDYMDVCSQQIVSVSASLIPFLEHDDANRALMGSNMQRQAVPLVVPEVPLVGTGMERVVAEDSGVVALAPFDGKVTRVTSSYVEIERDNPDESIMDLESHNRIYLRKFQRSNQDTTINQRPTVNIGDHVKKGDILSDGPAIASGRLALGRNMLVAFMPWYGYNYEDAIILSENVAREDMLTSIYIEEHEVLVRDTKNGKEELAYDIPNVPNKSLRNLDKTGIIRIGSVVKSGDIIVGKITPKNTDIDPSPEENLMRALFGDRAGDFSNSSLKAKPGMEGVVIDVKVFSKKEDRMDDFLDDPERNKNNAEQIKLEREDRENRIDNYLSQHLGDALVGEIAKNIVNIKTGIFMIPSGKKIDRKDLEKVNFKKLNLDYDLIENTVKNDKIYQELILRIKKAREESENIYKKQQDRIKRGDELPHGVRKMVKVFIAKKRKIQVGDKMAGRHGNKGVISRISPIADMPFMRDGKPVDVILNPLGVPSRMNIGQIMETHLGMAALSLGFHVETPVFDGATIEDIRSELTKAELATDGKMVLYDGKTGEPFKERVTVGIMYMLKLNHLVADKMHARSTGPYSLITQQPLGGKAQHGGQRLGEMEVWALEAYGASRLLEEMLTIKSDDVDGRTNAFKAISSGQNPPKPGVPESFNVLVSELKSLCFDIDFIVEKHEDVNP
ncbi:MAG: DNA-directed RNA polymerase subunit beta [Candidatus Stygibacter australis]|nr:DNA-directed RNA polymerase subunit beta [Candidatus Stygibacter australis]